MWSCLQIVVFFSAPLCPTPPAVPLEGVQDYIPDIFPLEPVLGCGVDSEAIPLQCYSFLSVYVQSAYIGRYKTEVRKLCNGTKGLKNTIFGANILFLTEKKVC